MDNILHGQYSAGTINGEHLLVEIYEEGLPVWSLHGVSGHKSYACEGFGRFETRDGACVLVMEEPDGSGGSSLLPAGPLDEELAETFLVDYFGNLPVFPHPVEMPRQ